MKKINRANYALLMLAFLFAPVLAGAQTNEPGWMSLGDFLKSNMEFDGKGYKNPSPTDFYNVKYLKKIAYKPSKQKVNDGKSTLDIVFPVKIEFSKPGKGEVKFTRCAIDGNFQFKIKDSGIKDDLKQYPSNSEGWKVYDWNSVESSETGDDTDDLYAYIGEVSLKKGLESDILKNIYVLPADISGHDLMANLASKGLDKFFYEKSYMEPKNTAYSIINLEDKEAYMQYKINEAKASYSDLSEKELEAIKNQVEKLYKDIEWNHPQLIDYIKYNNGDFASSFHFPNSFRKFDNVVGALRNTTPDGIIEESKHINFSLDFPNGDKLISFVPSLLFGPEDSYHRTFIDNYLDLCSTNIEDPENKDEKIKSYYPLFRLEQTQEYGDSVYRIKLNGEGDRNFIQNLKLPESIKFKYFKKGEDKPLDLHYSRIGGSLFNHSNHECYVIDKGGLKRIGLIIGDYLWEIPHNIKDYRVLGNQWKYILENGDYIGNGEVKITFEDGTVITTNGVYSGMEGSIKFANGDSFTGTIRPEFIPYYRDNGPQKISKLIEGKRKIEDSFDLMHGRHEGEYVIEDKIAGLSLTLGIPSSCYKTKDGKTITLDNDVYARNEPKAVREGKMEHEKNVAQKQQRRQELIKKYGKKVVDSWEKSEICVGMPLSLVKSLGSVYKTDENKYYIWYKVKRLFGGGYVYFKVNKATEKVESIIY